MGRLIELDAALEGLENLNAISFYEANEHSKEAYTETKDMLKALPTVDAVEVVRCKDCMHYGFTDNRIPEEQVWWCYFWDDVRSPDAYCSDGEREDGDGND